MSASDEVGGPADAREGRWHELDDTLADGPAPVELPADLPEEVRIWLAEQRTMHGLLRAMHTADATAREGRIGAILARIDAHQSVGHESRWFVVAAAALLLAALGVWWSLPASLPTAEAAVQRAVGELLRDVDRRFHIEWRGLDRNQWATVQHEFELVIRPGNRFRIKGRFTWAGLRLGRLEVGCDGQEVWVLPNVESKRRSGPLAERERLLDGLGFVLDVGYLDMHALIERLPADFRLHTVGRVTDATGRAQLRIEARPRRLRPFAKLHPFVKLHSVELLVDEPSGMITRLAAEVRKDDGIVRELIVEYRGEATPGTVEYGRPW